jgi:hypothetical protein
MPPMKSLEGKICGQAPLWNTINIVIAEWFYREARVVTSFDRNNNNFAVQDGEWKLNGI